MRQLLERLRFIVAVYPLAAKPWLLGTPASHRLSRMMNLNLAAAFAMRSVSASGSSEVQRARSATIKPRTGRHAQRITFRNEIRSFATSSIVGEIRCHKHVSCPHSCNHTSSGTDGFGSATLIFVEGFFPTATEFNSWHCISVN